MSEQQKTPENREPEAEPLENHYGTIAHTAIAAAMRYASNTKRPAHVPKPRK